MWLGNSLYYMIYLSHLEAEGVSVCFIFGGNFQQRNNFDLPWGRMFELMPTAKAVLHSDVQGVYQSYINT